MAQVDAFRMRLHEQFTVFDPLSIDERILSQAYDCRAKGEDHVAVELAARWPTGFSGEYASMAAPYDSAYPLSIPVDEIEEAINDIDRQIEARDFRLINQVQAVAAYRPDYGQHRSRGVSSELQYAAQTAGIPVHLIWDESEDGPYATSPFGYFGTRHQGIDQLISALSA